MDIAGDMPPVQIRVGMGQVQRETGNLSQGCPTSLQEGMGQVQMETGIRSHGCPTPLQEGMGQVQRETGLLIQGCPTPLQEGTKGQTGRDSAEAKTSRQSFEAVTPSQLVSLTQADRKQAQPVTNTLGKILHLLNVFFSITKMCLAHLYLVTPQALSPEFAAV